MAAGFSGHGMAMAMLVTPGRLRAFPRHDYRSGQGRVRSRVFAASSTARTPGSIPNPGAHVMSACSPGPRARGAGEGTTGTTTGCPDNTDSIAKKL